MTLHRRRFLKLATAAAALPAAPSIAPAQGLSDAPGSLHRRPGRRQRVRHHRTPDRAMVFRAPRPAIRGRDAAGRRRQYRDRVGDARACRRLHAVAGELAEHDQRRAAEAQLRIRPRHRAGRHDRSRSAGHGGQPLGAGQHGPRVHRLRQGQSRQDQHGLGRHRRATAHGGRVVQVHGRRGSDACALSRHDAGGDRPPRRPGAGHVRRHAHGAAAGQGGKAAAARCDDDEPPAGAARCADGERFYPWLRGVRLDRHRRAQGHATRHHRNAQQADQRDGGRHHLQAAVDRPRRRGRATDVASRFRKVHCRKYREMGQGDQVRRHQTE